jgi:murein DD-endopeptidase MepM/ murein hydrolase activator NlpD
LKKNEIIKTAILTFIIVIIVIVVGITNRNQENATKYYQVYLNGNKLGLIADKNELYNLINEEQKDIKETYNVSNVYPPNGFNIEEYTTYSEDIEDVKTIYEKIKEEDDFTIEAYTVKIKFNSEEKEDITLYVLNEDIFKEALTDVVTAFVDSDAFLDYINNEQEAIDDVGSIIEKMYFEETITIKKSLVSIHENIYTDANTLTQYLLFGSSQNQTTYIVQSGDTISSISENNKLNTQEFLIANPKYRDESSILAIGEKVNITLINPVLTLVEDLYVVEDSEQVYEKETVYDSSKDKSFSEVTTPGITGIVRTTRNKQVVNGEENQGSDPISTVTIREVQNEVTTKGGTKPTTTTYNKVTGIYVDTGTDWGWPTNRPYQITSDFAYRWGSFHNGIDISGTGEGSQIYAARDGVVYATNNTCANKGYYGSRCGNSYGNYVVIKHDNGLYTMYAHMLKNINVSVGDTVTKGTIVGYMGSSGSSTGTHVHFGVSSGEPNMPGSSWLSPWKLYK